MSEGKKVRTSAAEELKGLLRELFERSAEFLESGRDDPERALEQIRVARATGAAGDALFSYDSIADAPALREALIREAASDR